MYMSNKCCLSFFSLILFIQNSFASQFSTNISNKYFPVSSSILNDEIGIIVQKYHSEKFWYFKISKKDWNTEELSEKEYKIHFKLGNEGYKKINIMPRLGIKEFKLPDETKISYEYVNCSGDSNLLHFLNNKTCKELLLKINEKKYLIESNFYWNQNLADPELYGDYIIFRGFWKAGVETDSNKKIPETVDSIVALDLIKLQQVRKLSMDGHSPFFGPDTTLIKSDPNEYFWIGNNHGFYGLDKNLDEKISCNFLEIKKGGIELRCVQSDYLLNNKKEQALLLDSKIKAIKLGKKPPEDTLSQLKEYENCMSKIDSKLSDEYFEDKSDDKILNSKYSSIAECLLKGTQRMRERVEIARKKLNLGWKLNQ